MPLVLVCPVSLYPYPQLLHPALRVSIRLIQYVSKTLSSYLPSFLLSFWLEHVPPILSYFTRCISCVCLSPYSNSSSTSSSHHLTALLHTIDLFPNTVLAAVLTSCSHPSIILSPASSLHRFLLYILLPRYPKIALHFRPSLFGTLPIYFLLLVYILQM